MPVPRALSATADKKRPAVEIQVSPSQAKRFALSQPERKCERPPSAHPALLRCCPATANSRFTSSTEYGSTSWSVSRGAFASAAGLRVM
jgi:hypothetical protein